MKTKLTVLLALLIGTICIAQQGINYKALIKDANGNALAETSIRIHFSILEDPQDQYVPYSEYHIVSTDINGIVIVNIGNGTQTSEDDPLADLAWNSTDYYLVVEVDITGGTDYVYLGTTQFMEVPYAKHATTAKTATFAINSGDNNWQKNDVDIINKNTGKIGFGVTDPKVKFHFAADEGFLFGTDTIGAGTKMMYVPDRNAFRIGTIATGAASIYWDNIPNILDGDGSEGPYMIGKYSFATGLNTRAQGYGATAMGRDTEAAQDYAFASGYLGNANGKYSTAMGYNSDAFGLGSTALGYSCDAEANYSFAVGYFVEAQAEYATAMGNNTLAQSYNSTAIGAYNVGGGNTTAWIGTSPLFEIGNGTGISTRSNAMTVLKNGRVGIGTTDPFSLLHVDGDVRINNDARITGEVRIGSAERIYDGGALELQFEASLLPNNNAKNLGNSSFRWNTVYATNGTINTSDKRDKENITNLSYGLNEIMQLRPVSFTWKEDSESGRKLGLVAQDLQKVIKEVVVDTEWQTDEKTGKRTAIPMERLGVYYSDLIPVLIKATQEQQTIIEKQQKQIDELKVLVQAQLNKN